MPSVRSSTSSGPTPIASSSNLAEPATATEIGLIAGGGDLPSRLIDACRSSGRGVFVVVLEGHGDPAIAAGLPHMIAPMGQAGHILAKLKSRNVRTLCLAGRVRRPSLKELQPDWRAARFLARVSLRALGDDGLLGAVRDALSEEGFAVVGAHELLADLMAPVGPIGQFEPGRDDWTDIARGFQVAHRLGELDVGQAVIVKGGLVLAVEAIEGTDAMIERAGSLMLGDRGGVLVKAKKPQQDPRLDLPTIGVETVERAARSGLAGIAIEAGGSIVVDRDKVAEAADRLALFVVAVDPRSLEQKVGTGA